MVTLDTLQSPARSERDVVAVAVCDGFYGCGSGAGRCIRLTPDGRRMVIMTDTATVLAFPSAARRAAPATGLPGQGCCFAASHTAPRVAGRHLIYLLGHWGAQLR